MRSILFALGTCALAQSSDPRVNRMVDDYLKQHRFSAAPKPATTTLSGVLPLVPQKPCSVPLIEMQIPKDVNFTMRQMDPPTAVDKMPQVIVPAPACPGR
jgi:hypothetical protein